MRYTLVLLGLVAFVVVNSADQPESKRCTQAQCDTFCKKSNMGNKGSLEGSMCLCSSGSGNCNKQACLDFCKACNEGFTQASCPRNWCQCM